jgi:hypothetical protein
MRLDEYQLELVSHPDYGPIAPFVGWVAGSATKSLPWYEAYNATKHDRESCLDRATISAVVNAVAAAHIMIAGQFGFDAIEAGSFHQGLFKFTKTPRWLGDAYVRPLHCGPNPSTNDLQEWNDWVAARPRTWRPENFPFTSGAP